MSQRSNNLLVIKKTKYHPTVLRVTSLKMFKTSHHLLSLLNVYLSLYLFWNVLVKVMKNWASFLGQRYKIWPERREIKNQILITKTITARMRVLKKFTMETIKVFSVYWERKKGSYVVSFKHSSIWSITPDRWNNSFVSCLIYMKYFTRKGAVYSVPSFIGNGSV